MNKMWNTTSPWVKAVVGGLVLLLAYVAVTCGGAGGEAKGSSPNEEVTAGVDAPSADFTENGTPVNIDAVSEPTALRVRSFSIDGVLRQPFVPDPGVGRCYVWEKAWNVKDGWGRLMYSFGFEVYACFNETNTRVVSYGWSNMCKHFGGYFEYHGCDKQRSAFGLSQLSFYDVFSYDQSLPTGLDNRHPSVDATIKAGSKTLNGSVYFDI